MKNLITVSVLIFFSFNVLAQQLDSSEMSDKLKQIEAKVQKTEPKINSITQKIEHLELKYDSLHRKNETLSLQNQILFEQTDSLIEMLSDNRNRLVKTNRDLTLQKNRLEQNTDSLKKLYNENAVDLKSLQTKLSRENQVLKDMIDQTSITANSKISNLNKTLDRNTLYWILAVVIVGLLALIAFIFLKRKLSKNQSSVTETISNTRKELESEALKLDEKLIQILDSQLKLQSEKPDAKDDKEDHSLALKVAYEIIRMQKNIARIGSEIKGTKSLEKGLTRIKESFAAQGYEMPELLGKEYDDRMNIEVITFEKDESIAENKAYITKVIKPQVNYKEKLIQRAQVDVKHN